MGTQMFFYVLLAFLLGLLVGWFIWGSLKKQLESLRDDNGRMASERDRFKSELDACGRARGDLDARVRDLDEQLTELRTRPMRNATITPAPAQLISMPSKRSQASSTKAAAVSKSTSGAAAKAPAAKKATASAKTSTAPSTTKKAAASTAGAAAKKTSSAPAKTAAATTGRSTASAPAKAAPATAKKVSAPAKSAGAPKKPAAASSTRKDDLRKMIGIGPVNERLLRKVGVTTFAQIATWTAADIKRVEGILEFDGRIERERWVEQAKLLAAGNEKEFLRRFPTAGTDNNT